MQLGQTALEHGRKSRAEPRVRPRRERARRRPRRPSPCRRRTPLATSGSSSRSSTGAAAAVVRLDRVVLQALADPLLERAAAPSSLRRRRRSLAAVGKHAGEAAQRVHDVDAPARSQRALERGREQRHRVLVPTLVQREHAEVAERVARVPDPSRCVSLRRGALEQRSAPVRSPVRRSRPVRDCAAAPWHRRPGRARGTSAPPRSRSDPLRRALRGADG